MNRRSVLGAMGGVGIVSLSGCLGVLGLTSHEASPTGVDATIREETGYAQTSVDELGLEEDVDFRLWSETVTVTNYVTEHEKTVTVEPLIDQRAATFVVLSTPRISIARQQVNPIEDMSTGDLVELVADSYDDVGNVEHEGDDEITILDETTTVSTFAGDASFAGQDVRVSLHVTEAVVTEDDLIVAIGVYPEALGSQERDNVWALLEAIVEDVDEDVTEDPDASAEDGDAGEGESSADGDGDDENDGGDDDGGDDEGDDDDGGIVGSVG